MDKLPVVWYEGVLGLEKRSRYGLASLLNEAFDNTREFEFIHCSGWEDLPGDSKEAIVVVHGEHLVSKVGQIEADLNKLDRSLIVLFCDESSMFPGRRLEHPRRKIWLQTPVPNQSSSYASRYLICGYPHDAQTHLNHFDAHSVNRPLDWFFSGQVTHGRRTACVQQLRNMTGGLLKETAGFWQGLERSEYYRRLSEAKIIPCPSGPATPDTIRVAEALEAGCVPLVDGNCSRAAYPNGYWNFVLKSPPPFRIVDNWSDLPAIMAEELTKWPANRDALMQWWVAYKRSMSDWLREDWQALRK